MTIGKTLYVKDRRAWRAWLARHHDKDKEIWLVFYKAHTNKPRIPYNDAVEEALCYGWIDSIVKRIDDDKFAQKFSPRRSTAKWSEPNKERVRRLIKQGKMTRFGLAKFDKTMAKEHTGAKSTKSPRLVIPPRVLKALKANKTAWANFQKFPQTYKRIRIGWIVGAMKRPELFQQRLRYFIKMTAQNRKYGQVQ